MMVSEYGDHENSEDDDDDGDDVAGEYEEEPDWPFGV